MKRVTASDAYKNWFRLLDEVVAGEVVVIERKGKQLMLRRESERRTSKQRAPDYSGLLDAPDADAADSWGWEWTGPDVGIEPTAHRGS